MSHQTIIDVDTLALHLSDPAWLVVDCRFELGDPAAGALAFARSHIPGAIYAHLENDLSAPRTPWSGRHPLPDVATLAATFGRLAIGAGIQVVACDDSSGAYAARLWWLLRWLGHRDVAVLDGGLAAWRARHLPMADTRTTPVPREFNARPDHSAHLSADEVAEFLARGVGTLLDARASERYEGRVEPLDPKAGHVPGARSHPYSRNLSADGRFLDAAALRQLLASVLGAAPPRLAVSMCGSGVTACHTLLALEIAGLEGARLYPGSWSEWCRDPGRPVATGADPI